MVELFVIENFLDAATREGIVAEMRSAANAPAKVYGKEAAGAVDAFVRRVARVDISPETRDRVARQLLDRKGEIERYFGLALGECEEPQFLRYKPGDFFVAHQDGNTPLIRDETRFRKISIVIFLNTQSDEPTPDAYGGGSLVLHEPYPNYDQCFPASNNPGALAAFRSETTHEVTPVLHGERYTIVSWYR